MPEYLEIDEALAPLHEHLGGLVPIDERDGAIVERVEVTMPIELDVLSESDGSISLASSPPLYYERTGFRSAPHRIRVVIVDEQELIGSP